MENILEFVKPELLVLAPALYVLGAFLKQAAWFNDRAIPAMLGLAGMVLAALWVAGTTPLADLPAILTGVFTAIVQGLLCAGLAVYSNQIIKQAKKEG